MKQWWLLIGGFVVLICAGLGWLGWQLVGQTDAILPSSSLTNTTAAMVQISATPNPSLVANPSPSMSPLVSTTVSPVSETNASDNLPRQKLLEDVPFIPQAPHQVWDEIHKETCEEAAVLTVVAYLRGEHALSADAIEEELQAIIQWERDNLGIFEDTTAEQTARILAEKYGYGDKVRVVTIDALDDIRAEIAAGRPVILPAAGRLLGNRYFQTPGPIYHMVVAIGYDRDEIITHDPGTRRGALYRYRNETFWNAIHDFVDRTDEGMATGAKVAIVVDPSL